MVDGLSALNSNNVYYIYLQRIGRQIFGTETGEQQISPLRRFRSREMVLLRDDALRVLACAKWLRWRRRGGDDIHSSRLRWGESKTNSPFQGAHVRQDLYQWLIVIWANKNYLHRNVSFAISLRMSHECGCARYPARPGPIPSSASFG
jgi:hypothetical protein